MTLVTHASASRGARPAVGQARPRLPAQEQLEEAVGDQWGGLNIGHLYQLLDRLGRDGLIESERQPQQVIT